MGNTAFFASLLICGVAALALLRRPPRSLVILLVSLIAVDVLIVGTWFGVERVVERIQETGQYDEATGRYRDEARLDVDEETLPRYLDTRVLPDPDLVIRTSGEARISNFLLWQSAYSEYEFIDTLWPDFTAAELERLCKSFGSRERRFGAVPA